MTSNSATAASSSSRRKSKTKAIIEAEEERKERVRAHLDRAIKLFDGLTSQLSLACGYAYNTVWRSRSRGSVSPVLAAKIERATDGKVTAQQLCPQVFELLPRPRKSRPKPKSQQEAANAG